MTGMKKPLVGSQGLALEVATGLEFEPFPEALAGPEDV